MSASSAIVSECNSMSSSENCKTASSSSSLSRYESQKRRDWNTFGQYLKNHKPPLVLSRCSGAHILEFLRYLDQFGKTKVHGGGCPFYGQPHPPAPCPCPLRQAWGSLDALVGRLRAAFEENGGRPETNPFGARAVRLYLREIRDTQAKARGIVYEKKKREKLPHVMMKQQLQLQQQQGAANLGDQFDDGVEGSDHQAGFMMMGGSTSTSTSSSGGRGGSLNILPLSVFN